MVFHESYWKRDGKVYFCDSTVKGADFETFRPLSGVWAVDKKYVYEVGCKLRRADLTSFLVLNEVYARDNAHVFYLGGIVSDVHVESFEVLDAGEFESEWGYMCYHSYARDKDHIYFQIQTIGKPRIVRGADRNSFRVIHYSYARDDRQIYFEGYHLPGTDPGTFDILGRHHARDAKQVLYGHAVIPGADPSTFEVVDEREGRARDVNHEYLHGQVASSNTSGRDLVGAREERRFQRLFRWIRRKLR